MTSGSPVRRLVKTLRDALDLRDAFAFSGIGCVAYGIAQIYPPAAWIAAGLAFFWLGIGKR